MLFRSKISGETLAANIEKRGGKTKHGCHTGCVIQCSQVYHGKDGKYLTTGFEYETIWGFGANLLIDNLDDIAEMDRTCDEIGMDTIEMANTMAMAMEGGVLAWGDSKGVLAELDKVALEQLGFPELPEVIVSTGAVLICSPGMQNVFTCLKGTLYRQKGCSSER